MGLVIALHLLTVSAMVARAKEKKVSKTVTGLVLDENENGLAGATVQLTDLQTGKKMALFTEEDGRYKFADLAPNHDYELQAAHGGLTSEVRRLTSFDPRTRFVINLRISASAPNAGNEQK